jgi:hypothetical protein
MRRASIEPLSKPSVSARGRSYGASVRRAWLDLWLSVGSMDPISRSMLLLNRGGRFKRRYTHCRHASSPLKRASIDPLVKPSVSARGRVGGSVTVAGRVMACQTCSPGAATVCAAPSPPRPRCTIISPTVSAMRVPPS